MNDLTPAENREQLARFVGQWSGEERIGPNPQMPAGATLACRTNCRLDLGGWFVLMDYEQDRAGEASYHGHGLLGFDDDKQKFTMYWFDSDGWASPTPALGTWEGEALVLHLNDKIGHTRFTFEFSGADEYSSRIEASQDETSWSLMMAGTHRREK